MVLYASHTVCSNFSCAALFSNILHHTWWNLRKGRGKLKVHSHWRLTAVTRPSWSQMVAFLEKIISVHSLAARFLQSRDHSRKTTEPIWFAGTGRLYTLMVILCDDAILSKWWLASRTCQCENRLPVTNGCVTSSSRWCQWALNAIQLCATHTILFIFILWIMQCHTMLIFMHNTIHKLCWNTNIKSGGCTACEHCLLYQMPAEWLALPSERACPQLWPSVVRWR